MTVPMRSMPEDKYELYRVITDYEALQDGFLDRLDDLNTTMSALPGFADGVAQKLLSKNPGPSRHVPRDCRTATRQRTFGWKSLGKMLHDTGLALVLVVDDERFAPRKDQLMKRKRPCKPAMAGKHQPTWLFRKDKAREMGKRRFSLMSDSEKKRHQRKAGKARAKRMTKEKLREIAKHASNVRWAKQSGTLSKSQSSGIA